LARLTVLQPDPLARARLRDALGEQHELTEAPDWPSLRQQLLSGSGDGCVVDPFVTDPSIPASELARLRVHRPHLVVVVFADFTGRGGMVAEFSEVLDDIIVAGVEDDPYTIRSVVEEALGRALARRVLAEVVSQIPEIESEALGWAIEHTSDDPDVDDLARGLGTTAEALQRLLHASGAVSARRALLWGRLFRAAQMLGREGRTVTRAALALGYTSDSALRRALRDHLGMSPTEATERGGVSFIVERYLQSRRDSAQEPPSA